MPAMDEACSATSSQLKQQQSTAPLLMKVKLGRPRKGTVAPTACLSEDDKKGRRRAANRESARRMRARRAENVTTLTTQVNQLKSKCERLHNHNQAIRLNWKKVALENNRLRARFLQLQQQGNTSLPPLSPPTTLPPELEDALVPPFDDEPPHSAGHTSSTNETDLLSCLTPGFPSSPGPTSQPAVSSPSPQQVPQLSGHFSPPCSPSSSQPLLPEPVSPFASVPQAPLADPPSAPPSPAHMPRLKHPRPQSASLPPQWGVGAPAGHQADNHPLSQNTSVTATNTLTHTHATSHGTVVLDPLPTVTSSAAPLHPQPHSSQPTPPPTFSHGITLRTGLLPDHLPHSLLRHPHPHPHPASLPQHPSAAPWNPPFHHPASAPTAPNPSLPHPLDPLDPTFPWPPTTTPHPLAPAPTLDPTLRAFSSKALDPAPSLSAFPRSFSKQLEAMPSLGSGTDPLERLINSWDILSCLPPHRQHSLDPMSSMGSLPLLDDHPALFPSDLHAPQGQASDDSQPGQVPMLSRLSTPPMFFR